MTNRISFFVWSLQALGGIAAGTYDLHAVQTRRPLSQQHNYHYDTTRRHSPATYTYDAKHNNNSTNSPAILRSNNQTATSDTTTTTYATPVIHSFNDGGYAPPQTHYLSLYYYGYRYYNSELGRWITRDPIADGMNLYQFVLNCPVDLYDLHGLLAVTGKDKTSTIAVKCGGFFGIGSSKAGDIVYTYYDWSIGEAVGPQPLPNGRARAYLNMTFTETDSCCCPDGDYRWKQTVVKDTDPGRNNEPPYKDGDALPYYNSSSGSPLNMSDAPDIYFNNLYSPAHTGRPRKIIVKFETQLVCVENGSDKVLKTIKWGFKAKALKKPTKDALPLWYKVTLF